MRFGFVALLVVFVAAARINMHAEGPCTRAQRIQVQKEAGTLRNWDSLYLSFAKFRHCDDSQAQEGYSESIARILVDHWDALPRLAQLIEKDKSFGKFVGLNATMDAKDVAQVKANATKRCPAGLAALCARLRVEADEAVAEQNR